MNRKIIGMTIPVLTGAVMLSGCVSQPKFKASDFSPIPKTVTKTKVVNAADSVKASSFNYKPDPAVMNAYKKFITKGKMDVVETKGFVAYPFDANFQPVIPAQPLQAVDIALEPGEKIQPNGIAMGDTERWTYTLLFSYNRGKQVQHIIFKPKAWDIATNIIVGTNQRTYHFGLVSTKKADVKQVRFWYPEEMQKKANEYINSQGGGFGVGKDSSGNDAPSVIADVPNVNIKTLNFNYSMSGDEPSWKPVRVFSDNVHTYIQFPSSILHGDMPVLYVYKDSDKQLVNYRAKGNYFIVDGVYPQMVLILGRPGYFFNLLDNRQELVYITNNKLAS